MNTDSKTIKIEFIKSASKQEMIALYKDAGWWKPEYDQNTEFLGPIVKDSALFAGAFYQQTMIGMGRALSDLSSDAYIQDVVVLKTFRGQGIGQKITNSLVSRLKQNGVDWIGLIGEPGTTGFYENPGFEVMKAYVPLKYKD